ncbi:MAG: DNA polymerase III subunit delta [Deltaproteobacteria bacterium]|nr:DNA polymerase III subunit delta [Deltaproteobacteria bacterium]
MNGPVIQLIVNNEDFLTSRHLDKTLRRIVDPATKDFNYDSFSARETGVDKLIVAMQTLPMMAENRVVVVRDVDAYLTSEEAGKKAAATEALTSYFKDPNPQTHVIMVANKIDKRTSFYKVVSKVGEFIEFKSLYPNQVPQFIEAEARGMGLTLQPGCAGLIAETVGVDLMSVVSELTKLGLYVTPDHLVTRKHVKELVTAGLVENIFLITGLIANKKYADVCNLFIRMQEQGEPLILITSLIISHFRKLLKIKSVLSETQSADERGLAAQLGINNFFIRDYISQSKKFTLRQLNAVYNKLMDLSVGIRSTGPSPETLFEAFLQETGV